MAFTLKGKLDEIVTNVGALDSDVISTYTSAITSFVDGSSSTQISTIENTTNDINTNVSTIANTIDAISTEISTIEDTTNDINTNVSTVTNTIDAISTEISTISAKTYVWDANLIPENIVSGVTIFGVTGTHNCIDG